MFMEFDMAVGILAVYLPTGRTLCRVTDSVLDHAADSTRCRFHFLVVHLADCSRSGDHQAQHILSPQSFLVTYRSFNDDAPRTL